MTEPKDKKAAPAKAAAKTTKAATPKAAAAKSAPAKAGTGKAASPAKASAVKKAPAEKKAPVEKKASVVKKAPAASKAAAEKQAPVTKKATVTKKAPAAKKAASEPGKPKAAAKSKKTAPVETPRESVSGATLSFSSVQEPPEHLTLRVDVNRVVAFHYRLREIRRDGSVSPWLEASFGRQPLLYLHGHGNVVPGLEQGMAGKKAGDAFEITLTPEQAYGHRTSNEILRIPIKHLHQAPDRKYLVPGVIVSVKTNQGVRNALVIKVGKFNVDLDTNHPYAGRTLQYQIEVLGVRQASPEEVAHRHVHGPGGHQH